MIGVLSGTRDLDAQSWKQKPWTRREHGIKDKLFEPYVLEEEGLTFLEEGT